ncbi:acyl carrier protein, partial [Saccharomonospora azurea]
SARSRADAVLVPVALELGSGQARAEDVPPLLRSLVRVTRRAAASRAADSGDSLARRLAGLSGEQQRELLIGVIREQAALVLGYQDVELVESDRSFRELGFDSLTAIELRNRLNAATGLKLPATLVFDYPTPQDLAEYLRGELVDDHADGGLDAELDRLAVMLSSAGADRRERERIGGRLAALLSEWNAPLRDSEAPDEADDIESATADELFELLDKEFGNS